MKPTNHIVMVRPATFRTNEQTAINNYYQKHTLLSDKDALHNAHAEFDSLVACLRKHQVKVTVVQDTAKPDTPDAIFPNNWFVLLPKQRAVLFPMYAPNRRAERNERIVTSLIKEGCQICSVTDYTKEEEQNLFLEGTGSMVIDHQNRIAYCALSPRSELVLFHRFCKDFNYKAVVFHAYQTVNEQRLLVYHTNVIMSIGEQFAIICLDAIDNVKERHQVHDSLTFSGKDVISITEKQVGQFAGNMLALSTIEGNPLLVMSTRAYASLTLHQIQKLEQYAILVHSPIPTIEDLGGGSVRCMMAEVY